MGSSDINLTITDQGVSLDWYAIINLCGRIQEQWTETLFTPERIVAIGRGGLIPARLLAGHDLPVYYEGVRSYDGVAQGELTSYQKMPIERFMNSPSTLIVDDLWDSGDTFRYMKRLFPQATYAALITKVDSGETFLDYVGLSYPTENWIIFPWEVNLAYS